MKRVYLDHNATTPMRREVRELFDATLDRLGGNPSSLHAPGRSARLELDRARERTAAALRVHEDEIVFTSGGTEANNLALFGALEARGAKSSLVTSAVEHSSVRETAFALERRGHPLAIVGVDREGLVDAGEVVRAAATSGAALVSIMGANNEVGACMPIESIATARDRSWLLHSDLVQALGRRELPLGPNGVDLASFSCHKLGGPVGVGVLFRRRGVTLEPLMQGGGHEGGLRPGTENVAGIVAAALSIELAVRERTGHAARLAELAGALWSELHAALPNIALVGPKLDSTARLPGTLSVLAPHVDGKVLVTRLDLAGLELSAGSACASGSLEPSHVLRAMNYSDDEARAALRLSLGRSTTLEDVHSAVDILRRTLG